jgi:hypothetical protein
MNMVKGSKVFEITLGIVTSVGGFLDVGTIATAPQARAIGRSRRAKNAAARVGRM